MNAVVIRMGRKEKWIEEIERDSKEQRESGEDAGIPRQFRGDSASCGMISMWLEMMFDELGVMTQLRRAVTMHIYHTYLTYLNLLLYFVKIQKYIYFLLHSF